MDDFPRTYAKEFEPIMPDSDLTEQANTAIGELAAHGFVVATGVQPSQVEQLRRMAGQDHIREYCPNDVVRFGDDLEGWMHKGRQLVGIYAVHGVQSVPERNIRDVPAYAVGMVAYGWYGPQPNQAIPEADITTAYRNSKDGGFLARFRRHGPEDRFSLGIHLGEMVTGLALRDGVEPGRLSLETYASNKANRLYDAMRYRSPDGIVPQPVERPTLRPVGEAVPNPIDDDPLKVRYDAEKGHNVVRDWRLFKRYQPDVK